MKSEPRCPRIVNETWKAPGGSGNDGYPVVTRAMQGRCVLGVGHVLSETESETRHIYGDWLEVAP